MYVLLLKVHIHIFIERAVTLKKFLFLYCMYKPGKCFCTRLCATSNTLLFRLGSVSDWNQTTSSVTVFPPHCRLTGNLNTTRTCATGKQKLNVMLITLGLQYRVTL